MRELIKQILKEETSPDEIKKGIDIAVKVLKKEYPSQKYWLTIEEEDLSNFYEQNGFTIFAKSENQLHKEWILVHNG